MEYQGIKPPYSLEAEEAVIGSIFLDPSLMPDVVEELRWNDFYFKKHQIIYKTMEELFDQGQPVDAVMVIEKLRASGLLESVGGEEELIRLAQVVPTPTNVMYYARVVKDKSLLRSLIKASADIVEAVRTTEDAEMVLDFAEKKIFEIAESRATRTYETLPNIMHEVFDRLDELRKRSLGEDAFITGFPTGFVSLDRMTSGFHPSDLIILAARPSMGKTALALNIATQMALKRNLPVAIFSLEMSREQLATRILSSISKVEMQKIKTGNLSGNEWDRLLDAAGELSKSPIIVDDEPNLDPRTLRAKARRLKREYNIKVVFIDYLQLMMTRKGQRESRQQEISEITRSLKLLAREIDVAIVALSQLSRAPEQREDKRPRLSDLRESGSIEQDADTVIFLYREAYYKRKKSKKDMKVKEEDELNKPHEAEVIIGKQRNGPVGTIKLMFEPQFVRFVEIERGRVSI